MSSADFLGRAIEQVKKAIETDTAGDYEKAYQLYYQAREQQVAGHASTQANMWQSSCSCSPSNVRILVVFLAAVHWWLFTGGLPVVYQSFTSRSPVVHSWLPGLLGPLCQRPAH